MSRSAFFSSKTFCVGCILIGNRVRVKSLGMAPGLANARPPGSAKFANVPPPGLTWRANALQWPGGRGQGAGRRWNWLMHNWTTLTTTDQSFPYQRAVKAYVITRRQQLINNFNLFLVILVITDVKSCNKIVWTVCGKHSGSISNRLLVILIRFDSYFKFHRQKLINKNYFPNELGSSLLPWNTT